ncbi:MAG: iron-sulfur cluster repair di-iron protein [bacterium]|nr:iron-sulfur cluster repair di-iron protein [bacterium]
MNIHHKQVIGELVAEDYRTAEVFSTYGIDFCCKGGLSIEAAAKKKGINPEALILDLTTATERTDTSYADFRAWPIDLLVDYLEKKHHRYVREKTPLILQYLAKVSQVHGRAHPEVMEIENHFYDSSRLLAVHMKREEEILFPFIRQLAEQEQVIESKHYSEVDNPILMMKQEHEVEGERFIKIAELSDNYTPPAEACNTYKVAYYLLKEFEADLQLHIHLENNVLFPEALSRVADQLTKTILQTK